MFYYKVLDNYNNLLGVISSLGLRYYNEKSKKILCCLEDLAQYVAINEKYYRTDWFNQEPIILKGKYPHVQLNITSEEEYLKYIIEQEEANSTEK